MAKRHIPVSTTNPRSQSKLGILASSEKADFDSSGRSFGVYVPKRTFLAPAPQALLIKTGRNFQRRFRFALHCSRSDPWQTFRRTEPPAPRHKTMAAGAATRVLTQRIL